MCDREFIKSNCHLSENLPFSVRSPLVLGNGDCAPITNSTKPGELSHSTARLTLTPLVASVRQSETRIMSRLGLESRTFDAPKIERHSLPSLNGSHVMKTFRAPHLLVKMDEKISVTIQNVQLAIINSILADIGLWLKLSPFLLSQNFLMGWLSMTRMNYVLELFVSFFTFQITFKWHFNSLWLTMTS